MHGSVYHIISILTLLSHSFVKDNFTRFAIRAFDEETSLTKHQLLDDIEKHKSEDPHKKIMRIVYNCLLYYF